MLGAHQSRSSSHLNDEHDTSSGQQVQLFPALSQDDPINHVQILSNAMSDGVLSVKI